MIRRRKGPQNVWLLLMLPFLGAVGWAIRRLVGRHQTTPAMIAISENQPVIDRPAGAARDKAVRGSEPAPGNQADTKEAVKESAGEKNASSTTSIAGLPAPEAPAAGHALRNQPEKLSMFFVLLVPFLILPVVIVLLVFRHIPVQSQRVVPDGNAKQGQILLRSWGCGACHTIPGVTGATGAVGPVLDNLTQRSYIAGHLQNTPDNMIQWIMHPQEISPGVDMPDSNVPESVARDMAAYLYSIH